MKTSFHCGEHVNALFQFLNPFLKRSEDNSFLNIRILIYFKILSIYSNLSPEYHNGKED